MLDGVKRGIFRDVNGPDDETLDFGKHMGKKDFQGGGS